MKQGKVTYPNNLIGSTAAVHSIPPPHLLPVLSTLSHILHHWDSEWFDLQMLLKSLVFYNHMTLNATSE